jgi:hypothetical protein
VGEEMERNSEEEEIIFFQFSCVIYNSVSGKMAKFISLGGARECVLLHQMSVSDYVYVTSNE